MMDQSITRRGQPCWYRIEGVNYIAINDSFMLEAPIYFLLKKYFRAQPYYVNLLELFHEVSVSCYLSFCQLFVHVVPFGSHACQIWRITLINGGDHIFSCKIDLRKLILL